MEERFETFTALIARISRSIKKIKNTEMADLKLKSIHVSCLYYLLLSDGLTAARLTERCDEDKGSISRAIEYLRENGYILPAGDDKKYNEPLYLTEKGKDAGRKIAAKIDDVLDEVSAGCSEEDRLTMYRMLTVISRNLEARVNDKKERN